MYTSQFIGILKNFASDKTLSTVSFILNLFLSSRDVSLWGARISVGVQNDMNLYYWESCYKMTLMGMK